MGAQQELSCKSCWEEHQPGMQEGTGRGVRMIGLVAVALMACLLSTKSAQEVLVTRSQLWLAAVSKDVV